MAVHLTAYFRCAILISSLTAVFSLTTFPPIRICGAPNFEVWNLTSQIWKFSLPSTLCLHTKTDNTTGDECEIVMAFCQSVKLVDSCNHSAVCETYKSVNDTYNLASYKLHNNPFNTSAGFSGAGFSTHYDDGGMYTKPDNTTCTLRTVMAFHCNASARWEYQTSEKVNNVPVKPRVMLSQGPEFCIYSFSFDFAGACPASTTRESTTVLSAGSVLLLIFFASLIIYVILGSFLNAARGKEGSAIMPHHDFWIMLPGYIKDGVQFTLSCGGRTINKQAYENI